MEMHEYLDLLTDQIRNKKAKQEVEQEIKRHIEDQALAYMEQGMEEKKAYQEAVCQMGSPMEVGIDMDRIHRPKNNWPVLGLAVLLSLAGLLVQYFCICRFGAEDAFGPVLKDRFIRQCIYTLFGLCVMGFLYLCDYTIFSRYGRVIGFLFLAAIAMACGLNLIPIMNGGHSYMKAIMYLFIPIYGGILFRYQGKGYTGIICSLLWLLAAAYTAFAVIAGGIGITADVMFVCALMFLWSLFKNWYQVARRSRPLIAAGVLALVSGEYFFMNLQPYQIARVKAVMNPWAYARDTAFQMTEVRKMIRQLKFLGGVTGSGTLEQTSDHFLPDVHSSYVMLQAASVWGILVAAVLAGLLILFLICLFLMVKRQKNQLGQLIGYGCVLILALETVNHLLINLGFYFNSTAGLPFFTFGAYHTVAVYGILGIILSVYRYQNLIWERKQSDPVKHDRLIQVGRYRLHIDKIN